MSMPLSRTLSVGTAVYAVYALLKPRHLGAVLTDDRERQRSYDAVATTYGCRDLVVSTLGLFGRSPRTVRTAMLIRIALDVSDAAVLTGKAETTEARNRVAAVTLGMGGPEHARRSGRLPSRLTCRAAPPHGSARRRRSACSRCSRCSRNSGGR